jgi:hypothetical protein
VIRIFPDWLAKNAKNGMWEVAMLKTTKFAIGIAIVLVLSGLAAFASWQASNGQAAIEEEPLNQAGPEMDRGMTLLEALDTASAFGETWEAGAAIGL